MRFIVGQTGLILSLILFQDVDTFSVRPSQNSATATVRLCASSAATFSPENPLKKEEKLTKEAEELLDALDGQKKEYGLVIAQTAPSVRVALPEEFGLPPGEFSPGILVAALKKLGFDLVLDTNTGADLTICEEGTELLHRLQDRAANPEATDSMPLFTSCCPGWLNFVEKSSPELAKYVSTCKSPHLMYGAMVKTYSQDMLGELPENIYMCSVMPCVRKRGESDHAVFSRNGIRDVDNVITTKDLGTLLRLKGITPAELEPECYDSPFRNNVNGAGTGAGQLFGATGGVMEAAVRTVYEIVTGEPLPRIELDAVRGLEGVKEAVIPLLTDTGKGLDMNLKIAVVNGLGEAKKLIEKIKDGEVKYDFVEVMACLGGCIGGGGQPKGEKGVLDKRLEVIYKLDRSLPLRRSHENPIIQKFYDDKYLEEYGSERAHELLHVAPVYGKQPKKKETS